MKPYLVQSFVPMDDSMKTAAALDRAIKRHLKEKGINWEMPRDPCAEQIRVLYPESGFSRTFDEAVEGFIRELVASARPPAACWSKPPEIEWNEDGYRIRGRILT